MMRAMFIARPRLSGVLPRVSTVPRWAIVAALLVAPSLAVAQQGTIAGAVVVEGSLIPIAGAQVSAGGIGDVTDASGRFRVSGLTGDSVTLEVRRIGFQPVSERVAVGRTNLRVTMRERVVELNEIVVTGTPIATEKRALGNSIADIDANAVVEKAQINSLQELLNGRAAGVVVIPSTGTVGSGARIRVRGTSSFSLSQQPLIYVDGVRINNDPTSGPINQGFGGQSISRMNDINPEDIESVEILKGPAAATLYGTEASNGVIQIITKRGSSGEPRWDFTVKQGANYFQDAEGRLWTNYQIDRTADTVMSIDIVEREAAAGRDIWRTGHLQEYDLSVSGGAPLFRYFLAGGYAENEGIDPQNRVIRYNTRANLTVTPSERLELGANLGYTTSSTTLPCEGGCGGRFWGAVLADPRNLTGANAARRGFHSGTPEQYDLLVQLWQDLSRFTGSMHATHTPFTWLRQRLAFGVDRTSEDNNDFTPRIDSLIGHPVWGNTALGWKWEQYRNVDVTTVDYAATASFTPVAGLTASTSLGAQYYHTATEWLQAQGSVFPVPGLSSVSATTQDRFNEESFFEEKSLGFFVQEQLGWEDRLFLTLGLRSDDHSAFGTDFDRAIYPKASLSWVVSEEPFFRAAFVDALKLRAAYGETGQQPPTFAAVPTFRPVIGFEDEPAITPSVFGNPELGPERGRELEIGFDAGFLENRLGIEFTYYHQRTFDAILTRQIPPSTGFPGEQHFNAGEIRNSGIELLATARPWDREPVSVEMTLSLATNDNEVVSLGELGEFVALPGGLLRHQVGFPVGSWFEQKPVSAEFDASGNVINVMCADGQGGTMPCWGANGRWGGGDDAPNVYLGRTTPDLEGAFSSTVTLFEQFRVYALFDYKAGFKKLDGNLRVRCYFFGGRCRENFFPTEFDPVRIANINSSGNLVDLLIDDADYLKFREFSVGYVVPAAWAGRVGVDRATITLAGRNLYTWTKFDGLEPEAFWNAGSRGGSHSVWEQTMTPQLTQWVLSVSLGL